MDKRVHGLASPRSKLRDKDLSSSSLFGGQKTVAGRRARKTGKEGGKATSVFSSQPLHGLDQLHYL